MILINPELRLWRLIQTRLMGGRPGRGGTLRSRRGASAALLQSLGADPRWQANLSGSLVAECTEIIRRHGRTSSFAPTEA